MKEEWIGSLVVRLRGEEEERGKGCYFKGEGKGGKDGQWWRY